MRKKSIILFILLLCMAFGVVCYVTWMRGIEEAIHFIKEDSPREILWGESGKPIPDRLVDRYEKKIRPAE